MTRIKNPKRNKSFIRFINKAQNCFLYILPAVLFFSYYPIIPLGANNSMNFELSLPLIWLLLFSLLSLPVFFKIFISLLKTPNLKTLTLLFPLYSSLSIFWSSNPLRAVLTAGIIWCLYISVFSIINLFSPKTNSLKISKTLLSRIFLFSSVAICLICWLQCFLDIFGVSRETTLLCLGCTSRTFGFPHPSGFAIEPQFMGNLLLAPTFYAGYLYIKSQETEQKVKKPNALLFFFFSSTLFLTFSRGAIYAFGVGYLLLLFLLISKFSKPVLKTLPILIFSFLFTLSAQGIFAELSRTNDTFLTGISKSLNQLSLGLIDLRRTSDSSDNPMITESSEENSDNFSVFDGYVEESTNIRLDLNASAISASLDSPLNFFFGYGLGSAGQTLFNKNLISSPKEIVQNEYLSLFLELGLFGLAFFLLTLLSTFMVIKKVLPTPSVLPERTSLYSLILALLLTLNFFSGLPNALHLYLFPVILVFLLSEDKPIINQEVNNHNYSSH